MYISFYVLPVIKLTLLAFLLGISIQYSPSELQTNVLINGDFSQPLVDTGSQTLLVSKVIPGWYCSHLCQIDNCKNRHVAQLSGNKVFANCSGQILDLNSDGTLEIVSQFVILKVGNYQFSFDYNIPVQAANKKTLLVYFNQQLVFYLSPQVQYQFFTFTYRSKVISKDGVNNITFTMKSYVTDQVGFRIKNVGLQRVYDPNFEKLLNYSLVNSVTQLIISVPGVRGILGEFVNFFISTQKLQLYGLHNRNYSYNSMLLLQDSKDLMELKGSLFQHILAAISLLSSLDNVLTNCLDYKLSFSAKRNPNSGSATGFMDTNASIFVYSLPICLLTMLLSKILFVMLYRWPASRLFRKFSFCGILLIMLCEGNVEQLTFYVIEQLFAFFSLSLTNKVTNAAVVLFYFTIFFSSVASAWWFRYHYRKNVRYFMQESKVNVTSLWYYTVERGIICFFCGVAHQILMSQPNIQLITLISIEILSIGLKSYFMSLGIHRNKIIAAVSILEGFIRVCFQIFCYLYANQEQKRLFVNEVIMPVIIYCFLGVWFIQITISITEIFRSMRNVHQISNKIIHVSKNSILPVNGLQVSTKSTQAKHKNGGIKPQIDIFVIKSPTSTLSNSPKEIRGLVRQSFLYSDYLKKQNQSKALKVNIKTRITGSKSNQATRSKMLNPIEQESTSVKQLSPRRYFLSPRQPIDLIYS